MEALHQQHSLRKERPTIRDCRRCGTPIAPNSKYCIGCGALQSSSTAETTPDRPLPPMAGSPMPELASSAPLPIQPAHSPLPALRSDPQPAAILAPEPIPSVPSTETYEQVGSAEMSELLTERRRPVHPLYTALAVIVLLLTIILGALYFSGIEFGSGDASSNTLPTAAAYVTPSAMTTAASQSEAPIAEEGSPAPDSTTSPSDGLSPEELEGREVSELMNNYQRAWVEAMNGRSMEPLLPYVTHPVSASEKNSVYNIVEAEIHGDLTPSGTRLGGLARYSSENDESIVYDMPTYILNESVKISDDKYQLRIDKRVRREATVLVNRNKPELGTYPPLTTFKETSYTYNVVRANGTWKVQSIEDGSSAPPVCYADESFSSKYERKDGKSTAQNGNCPGLAPNDR